MICDDYVWLFCTTENRLLINTEENCNRRVIQRFIEFILLLYKNKIYITYYYNIYYYYLIYLFYYYKNFLFIVILHVFPKEKLLKRKKNPSDERCCTNMFLFSSHNIFTFFSKDSLNTSRLLFNLILESSTSLWTCSFKRNYVLAYLILS